MIKNISIETLDSDLRRELGVYYVDAFGDGIIDIGEVETNGTEYKRRGYYNNCYFEIKCAPGEYFKLITLDNTGMVIGDLVPVVSRMAGVKPTFKYNYASSRSNENAYTTVYDWDFNKMHNELGFASVDIVKDYENLEPENIETNPAMPHRTEEACYLSLVDAYRSLGLEFGSIIPKDLLNTQEAIIITRVLDYVYKCIELEFYDASSCRGLMNVLNLPASKCRVRAY